MSSPRCGHREMRARAEPCPMGREPGKDARLPIAPSRTNARRQDAADAAQSSAARRAAKNKPSHRLDLQSGSRQDAGVDERVRHPCASRRTRRRRADLDADPVISARRREYVRTTGAGHGGPAPASRRTRRRCADLNPDTVTSARRRQACPNSREPGKDVRLHSGRSRPSGSVSAATSARRAAERHPRPRRSGLFDRPRSVPERVSARRAVRSAREGKPISGGG